VTIDIQQVGNILTNKELNKKALLQALEKSMGVVTQACKKVGVSRVTFYNYLKEDKEFAKAVKDIDEIALDFAISKMYSLIGKEDSRMIMYYLNNRGNSRGYSKIPKQESNNDRVTVNINGINENAI